MRARPVETYPVCRPKEIVIDLDTIEIAQAWDNACRKLMNKSRGLLRRGYPPIHQDAVETESHAFHEMYAMQTILHQMINQLDPPYNDYEDD